MPDVTQWRVLRCRVADPLKEALAKRPVEEILFDWFRSGRLVGDLSVLIKRRHPDVQVEIDRVYQEHLAKLGKGGVTRQRKTMDCREADTGGTRRQYWGGMAAGA